MFQAHQESEPSPQNPRPQTRNPSRNPKPWNRTLSIDSTSSQEQTKSKPLPRLVVQGGSTILQARRSNRGKVIAGRGLSSTDAALLWPINGEGRLNSPPNFVPTHPTWPPGSLHTSLKPTLPSFKLACRTPCGSLRPSALSAVSTRAYQHTLMSHSEGPRIRSLSLPL